MAKQERLYSKCIQSSVGQLLYCMPIESHSTLGIPDLYMHDRTACMPFPVWCELKDMSNLVTLANAKIAFEAGQMNRLVELYRSGALAFVQVYWNSQSICIALDGIDRQHERIKKETLDECLFSIPVGPLRAGGMFPTYEKCLLPILYELRTRQVAHPL